MADTIVTPRPLTKADVKAIRKQFTEAHRYEMRNSHPLSEAIWFEFWDVLDEVLEIGFTGVRRREAMAVLEAGLAELYQARFSTDYREAFSSRYIYDAMVEKFAPYGLEDKRGKRDLRDDERYVFSVGYSTLETKWADASAEELTRVRELLAKEPIELTDEEVEVLSSFTYNPYGRSDVKSLRAAEFKLAAIDRLAADFSTLSPDVQLIIGGEDGLEAKRLDIVEGTRYSGSSIRVGFYKEYKGRYEQARDLLDRELAQRSARERSREGLARAAARTRRA